MAEEKKYMPQSGAGLTRYFEESPGPKIKPQVVIGVIVAVIISELFLYWFLII